MALKTKPVQEVQLRSIAQLIVVVKNPWFGGLTVWLVGALPCPHRIGQDDDLDNQKRRWCTTITTTMETSMTMVQNVRANQEC